MILFISLFLACGSKTDTTKVEANNAATVNTTETVTGTTTETTTVTGAETVTGTGTATDVVAGTGTVIVTEEALVTEVSAIINSTTLNTENQASGQETKTSITEKTVSDE